MHDIIGGLAFMLVVLGQCLAVIAVHRARHEDWSARRSGARRRIVGCGKSRPADRCNVAALNIADPAVAGRALQSTAPQSATAFEIPLNTEAEEASTS
jgi:hypothetical protein